MHCNDRGSQTLAQLKRQLISGLIQEVTMKTSVKTEILAKPFSVRETVAQNRAYSLFKLGAVAALICSLGFLSSVRAQSSQSGTQDAAQASCGTTASLTTPQNGSAPQNNSSVQAQAKNVENAAKQLGSLFKKKRASTPAASANPCPAPAASAPAAAASVNAPAPAATPVAPAANSTPAAPEQPATASASADAEPSTAPNAGSGQAWTAPSGNGTAAAAPADPADLSKFPDISGLRLGMSLADAAAVMKRLYPRGVGQTNVGPFGPQHVSKVGVLHAQGDGRDAAAVDLTGPPNAPIAWQISRNLIQPKVAHNVIVDSLRKKFGKETYATGPAQRPITDDSQIQQMWWVFDEQGHLMPQARMINGTPFGCGSYYNTDGSEHVYLDFARGNAEGLPTYCTSSYVGVQATMSTDPILTDLYISIVDLPLMVRYAKASGAWAKTMDDKARQQDEQRANQLKPVL